MSWDRIPETWARADGPRVISYKDAVREAIDQAMVHDPRVFVMGLDIKDKLGCYGTMLNMTHPERVVGTPISEAGMTGVALGAALSGMRPIHTHLRSDFMLLGMDQIVNCVAKWRYMTRGQVKVPLVIRAIIGRGWGCGAQHSQTLQGLYSHIPGLKVVMPSNPHDAKGLMLAAIAHDWPVIVLEHRWLYKNTCHVPEEMYTVPLGRAQVLREGAALTVVAASIAAVDVMKACEHENLDAEVIDPRSIKPLDEETIFTSVAKTGRLVVVDYDFPFGGFAAELAARAAERHFHLLKGPVVRLMFPECSVPASGKLEKVFYPSADTLGVRLKELLTVATLAKPANGSARRQRGCRVPVRAGATTSTNVRTIHP